MPGKRDKICSFTSSHTVVPFKFWKVTGGSSCYAHFWKAYKQNDLLLCSPGERTPFCLQWNEANNSICYSRGHLSAVEAYRLGLVFSLFLKHMLMILTFLVIWFQNWCGSSWALRRHFEEKVIITEIKAKLLVEACVEIPCMEILLSHLSMSSAPGQLSRSSSLVGQCKIICCQFFASLWYKKALGEPNWLNILGWYQRNPCTQLPRREVWVSACVYVCVKTFIRSVQQLKGHLDYLQINQKVLPACLNQELAHAESVFQICVPLAPPTVWIIPGISVTQWICDGITAVFSEAQFNT